MKNPENPNYEGGDPTYAELYRYLRAHIRNSLEMRTNMTKKDLIDVEVAIDYGFTRWVDELEACGRITSGIKGLHKTKSFYTKRPLVR